MLFIQKTLLEIRELMNVSNYINNSIVGSRNNLLPTNVYSGV